jgi:Trypsin-like peptidase domain
MSQIAQQLGRRHLYASVCITATFYDRATGTTLKNRIGTAFLLRGRSREYLVTSRHLVDYNYRRRRESEEVAGAILERVELRGEFQPEDLAEDTKWYRVEYANPVFTFAPSDVTDLAVMVAHDPSRPPHLEQEIASPVWQLNHYGMSWLATTQQLNSVVPGDDVFIAGYPGLGTLGIDRPLLVSGIVSSDPRYPATFVDETLPSSVLCHSFSWGGMSGAPVVGISSAIGESKLFGVNAGHIASQGVAGGVIAHFVRSDALIELLVDIGEPMDAG